MRSGPEGLRSFYAPLPDAAAASNRRFWRRLQSMYKRLSSAAESAWAAPLFGKARDAEGTSFEAALKNPAYLPEHLEAKSQVNCAPLRAAPGPAMLLHLAAVLQPDRLAPSAPQRARTPPRSSALLNSTSRPSPQQPTPIPLPTPLPQRPADPVSVVDRPLSSIGSEDSASDAPDSPRAPSEPAAEPSKLPFSLPLSLPFRLALPAGPATPHPEEQAAALPAAHPVEAEAEEAPKKRAAGLRRALAVAAAAAVLGALGARRARKQAEEQQ